MESLIKELPRLIRSEIKLRALVLSEPVPLQLASGVARFKRAKSEGFSNASSLATRVTPGRVLPIDAHVVLAIGNQVEATSDRAVASSSGTGPFRRGRIVAGVPCG